MKRIETDHSLETILDLAREREINAVEATQRLAELGGYLLIGTVESEQVHTPQNISKYEDGAWVPQGKGTLATHLPQIAVVSAGVGDTNYILQRQRLGKQLGGERDEYPAYGWKADNDAAGKYRPYMAESYYEAFKATGDEIVGAVDVIPHDSSFTGPENGLYFSPKEEGHETIGSFAVRGTDISAMIEKYGLLLAPVKLI